MGDTVAQEKKKLRQHIRTLPPMEVTHLYPQFLALPQVQMATSIMVFFGVGREPDTKPLIQSLLALGKVVVLPYCLPEGKMEGRAITSLSQLELSKHNIPAPTLACPLVKKEDIQLILVPHLCCDKEGYRLGQGGGYYDRYLQGFTGHTVALCPKELLQNRVPREPFDCPVQLVLSDCTS